MTKGILMLNDLNELHISVYCREDSKMRKSDTMRDDTVQKSLVIKKQNIVKF